MRPTTLIQSAPFVLIAAFIAGFFDADHPRYGSPPLGELDGTLRHLASGLWVCFTFAADHPMIVAGVAALAVLVMVLRAIAALVPAQKDTQRLFTATQRAQGFDRAGGRCEMESWFWMRCHQPAEHGDHWFPHSRGGASDMANYVAACSRCNLRKGARVPTRLETMRLERRRRRYFPMGVPADAGSRFSR